MQARAVKLSFDIAIAEQVCKGIYKHRGTSKLDFVVARRVARLGWPICSVFFNQMTRVLVIVIRSFSGTI